MDPVVLARELIAACGIPVAEARMLLAHVLGVARVSLIARPSMPVPAAAATQFHDLCRRRAAGEPVAYLLGEREFFGRAFSVDASVLVPRPETEGVVALALELLHGRHDPTLVDLGTGSGCIAITLALERPNAQVWATDLSLAALQRAGANADLLRARVNFVHSNWYVDLPGRFDLIVSNPPYIAAGDRHLATLTAEPKMALTDDGDGLSCLRTVIAGAADHLTGGGALLVEHGFDQATDVRRLMEQSGLRAAQTRTDLAGLERASFAYLQSA